MSAICRQSQLPNFRAIRAALRSQWRVLRAQRNWSPCQWAQMRRASGISKAHPDASAHLPRNWIEFWTRIQIPNWTAPIRAERAYDFIRLQLLWRHLEHLPLPADARYAGQHNTAERTSRGIANSSTAHHGYCTAQHSQDKAQSVRIDLIKRWDGKR